MLRARNAIRLIALALALLVGNPAARAQEKAEHAAGTHRAVYEANVHDSATGKTTTKTFDLNKPEDAAALNEAIQSGHVHELRVQEQPTLAKLFSLYVSLGFQTLVVFVVLLLVLSWIAWPKMIAGLQKREDRIRGALDEAQKAKEEAQTIRVALQQQLDQAHDMARQIMDQTRRDAQQLREEELAKTKADIQAERERLHREIETETDQALQRIWAQAADLATLASAQALRRGLDGDTQRRLIDEALTDLRQTAAKGNGHA